jgi:hypothetical protein
MFLFSNFFSRIAKNNFLDKTLKKKFFSKYCFSLNFFPIYFFNFLKLGIMYFQSHFSFPQSDFLFQKKKAFKILNKIICFFINKNQKTKKNLTFSAKKKKIFNAYFDKYQDKKFPLFFEEVIFPKKKMFGRIFIQKEFAFINIYLFLNLFFGAFLYSKHFSLISKQMFMKIFFCGKKTRTRLNFIQKSRKNKVEILILKKKNKKKFIDFKKIRLSEKNYFLKYKIKLILPDFLHRNLRKKKFKKIHDSFVCFFQIPLPFLVESSFKIQIFYKIFEKKINCQKQLFFNKKFQKERKKKLIKVNGKNYLKIQKIGEGGSGKVYKIIDEGLQILALKKIQTSNYDQDILHNCLNEISILKTLVHQPRVVQIKSADILLNKGYVFIILEFGESDFEKIIRKEKKGIKDTVLLKFFWKQTLEAVQTIHEERIVHGDLKPSNFLIINQSLKIIDFGTARQIQKNTTNITRSLRIGTLNYMSPEAMVDISIEKENKTCFKISRSSDIWSLGCILYQMVYGNPPFYHLDFVKKIQAIIDRTYEIYCLPTITKFVVDVIKGCLQKNPDFRPSIPELLSHPFLGSRTLFHFKNQASCVEKKTCPKGDLNSRSSAYETDALPLSYRGSLA